MLGSTLLREPQPSGYLEGHLMPIEAAYTEASSSTSPLLPELAKAIKLLLQIRKPFIPNSYLSSLGREK